MMADERGVGVLTPFMEQVTKKSGRVLPKGRRRALRDLCYVLLTKTFGLSPADAHAVMTDQIHPYHVRRRIKALEPLVEREGVLAVMALMANGPDDASPFPEPTGDHDAT